MLLIPSPMQINREHRNINKTKLDTASLRFPPLRGPCGSWAPTVKGGDCAATVISYPMAKAEFLRLGMAIAQSGRRKAFDVILLALLGFPAVTNSKGPSFQALGRFRGFVSFSSLHQTCQV